MNRLQDTGNFGWTGNMYVGIPASGITNVPGMLPVPTNMQKKDAQLEATGGLEQLASLQGNLFAANYFLARGLPYTLASVPYDDLNQPWSATPAHCKVEPGCFDPPGQFCRTLKCPKWSYPIVGDQCIATDDILKSIPPGVFTNYGVNSYAAHALPAVPTN